MLNNEMHIATLRRQRRMLNDSIEQFIQALADGEDISDLNVHAEGMDGDIEALRKPVREIIANIRLYKQRGG